MQEEKVCSVSSAGRDKCVSSAFICGYDDFLVEKIADFTAIIISKCASYTLSEELDVCLMRKLPPSSRLRL
jgi:hypothetical protein